MDKHRHLDVIMEIMNTLYTFDLDFHPLEKLPINNSTKITSSLYTVNQKLCYFCYYSANQWTDFYMITAYVMKGLNENLYFPV